MKYICNNCCDQEPQCILDIANSVQPGIPLFCPYNNNPEWEPMKDFEMNGICADCSNCGCSCSDCDDASGFSNDAMQQHDAPLMSDNLRSEIDAANARLKAKIKDKDYRQESIVSKNKIKIEEMIDAHWSYIESVIRTSNEYGIYRPPMSLDDALKIREFDYKTAAKHFYGHGHEDGVIDMANTTVERLRK